MMSRYMRVVALLLLASLIAVAGCRSAPVQNVKNAPVNASKDNVTREDVREAIIRAGTRLGWRMRKESSGHLIGTLNIRDHQAQVDIDYTTSDYDITYRDSRNLEYDGEQIHSNYNGWIQNLDKEIRNELLRI